MHFLKTIHNIHKKQVQKKLHFTMHMERILHSKNNMSHALRAKYKISGLKDRHDKAGKDLSVRADHKILGCVCKTITVHNSGCMGKSKSLWSPHTNSDLNVCTDTLLG